MSAVAATEVSFVGTAPDGSDRSALLGYKRRMGSGLFACSGQRLAGVTHRHGQSVAAKRQSITARDVRLSRIARTGILNRDALEALRST